MPPPSPDNDLKRRARRRLIGAIALLMATIAVLPLLFEDQPPPGSALAIRMQKATPVPLAPVPDPAPASAPSLAEAGPAAGAETAAGPVETIPPLLPEPAPLPEENVAPAKPGLARAAPMPDRAEPSVVKAAKADVQAKSDKTVPPAQAPAVKPAAAPAPAETMFYVQLAALADAARAEELKTRAAHTGLPVATDHAGNLTRVRAGPFGSRKAAEDAAATLAANGIPGQVIAR